MSKLSPLSFPRWVDVTIAILAPWIALTLATVYGMVTGKFDIAPMELLSTSDGRATWISNVWPYLVIGFIASIILGVFVSGRKQHGRGFAVSADQV